MPGKKKSSIYLGSENTGKEQSEIMAGPKNREFCISKGLL